MNGIMGKSIQVQLDGIPASLKSIPNWVLWKYIEEGRDKPFKCPFEPMRQWVKAKSNDPATWSDYEQAASAYRANHLWEGIGFVFKRGEGFTGIDLDNCRNPETQQWAEWAREIIVRFDSYTELSPSGTGAKIYARGTSPFETGKNVTLDGMPDMAGTGKKPAVEIYSAERWFALTGHKLAKCPSEVNERQEAIDWLSEKYIRGSEVLQPNKTGIRDDDWFKSPIADRAAKYLEKLPPAISGSNGSKPTFRAACVLVLEFALSVQESFPILKAWSDRTSQPPWSDRELRHKLEDADRQPGLRGKLRTATRRDFDLIQVPDYAERDVSKKSVGDIKVTSLDDAAFEYLNRHVNGTSKMYDLGIPDLDYAIGGGVESGEMIMFAARPNHGKAQPLDASVLTPRGFVKMGSLSVGSTISGANGKPTHVTDIFPQGEMDVYKVCFSDGESCECTHDHLWFTQSRNERRRGCPGSVKALREIQGTIARVDSESPNHAIPTVSPVEFDHGEPLRVHPYLMGLLLGDGCIGYGSAVFSKPEPDLHSRIAELIHEDDRVTEQYRGAVSIRKKAKTGSCRLFQEMKAYGLERVESVRKFIPRDYMTASVEDRLYLLRGLLDTDGHVTKEGTTVEFCSSSPVLASQTAFLARSLGAIVRTTDRVTQFTDKNGDRVDGHPSTRVFIKFTNGIVPVASAKHLARYKPPYRTHRSIVSVEFSRKAECQCIKVAAEDQLYVTDAFAVTHNSMIAQQVIYTFRRAGIPCAFVSEEMGPLKLGKRLIHTASPIPRESWKYREDQVRKEITDFIDGMAPCYVVENCRTAVRVASEIDRLVKDFGVGFVVVDYAQRLTSGERRASGYDDLKQVSMSLKDSLLKNAIPGVVLAQAGRGLESRPKYIPLMSDLKECGQFEQDADVIVFQVWPHRINSENHPDEYKLYIVKNKDREILQSILTLKFLPSRQMLVQSAENVQANIAFDAAEAFPQKYGFSPDPML